MRRDRLLNYIVLTVRTCREPRRQRLGNDERVDVGIGPVPSAERIPRVGLWLGSRLATSGRAQFARALHGAGTPVLGPMDGAHERTTRQSCDDELPVHFADSVCGAR